MKVFRCGYSDSPGSTLIVTESIALAIKLFHDANECDPDYINDLSGESQILFEKSKTNCKDCSNRSPDNCNSCSPYHKNFVKCDD
jgi:hypothetical protein